MGPGLVLTTLLTAGVQADTGTGETLVRIRAIEPIVLAIIQEGRRRSPTFASLVDRVERSGTFVYVVRVHTLPHQMEGCLVHEDSQSTVGYLKIQLAMGTPRERLIVVLAHELQHVREVLDAGITTDRASLDNLFKRIGTPQLGTDAGEQYETAAAQEVMARVNRELQLARHVTCLDGALPRTPAFARTLRRAAVAFDGGWPARSLARAPCPAPLPRRRAVRALPAMRLGEERVQGSRFEPHNGPTHAARPTCVDVVRPTAPILSDALRDGRRRSQTVRTLLDRLDSSDLIVYLRVGSCPDPQSVACLSMIGSSNAKRFVQITFAMQARGNMTILAAFTDHLISHIGHELQHAIEVAGDSTVVDGPTLEAAYRHWGFRPDSKATTYESDEAIRAERSVLRELRSGSL